MHRGRTVDVHGLPSEDKAVLVAASRNEDGSGEKVRELLARAPEWIERLGSVADDAERAMSERGSAQALLSEALRAELRTLREALRYPSDGPLEELLCRRAALCWMELNRADEQRSYRWADGVSNESADFWDRHVSRLHGDFLRACKTLATVRKLRIPAIQVNVGAQQFNTNR